MRFLKNAFFAGVLGLCAPLAVQGASTDIVPVAEIGHVQGHVMLRAAGEKKLQPVAAGRALGWGEVLVSGDASRYEVRPAKGGGLWRVGRRAVFVLKDGGARLLAGTALVQVPADAVWRVESIRSVAALPAGSWIVQAVDNRGLKILCLDGGGDPVLAWGDALAPSKAAVSGVRLRPGELSFLQPEGRAFSPIATIYLEETLSTSRLVNGFSEPVPGMARLINQAIAQRERLSKLSNAVIVGAPQAGGFQVAVPNPPKPDKDAPAAKSP